MALRFSIDDDDEELKPSWSGKFYVLVEPETEKEQKKLLEQLLDEGYRCRALTS
jgi:hypothetical protein